MTASWRRVRVTAARMGGDALAFVMALFLCGAAVYGLLRFVSWSWRLVLGRYSFDAVMYLLLGAVAICVCCVAGAAFYGLWLWAVARWQETAEEARRDQ